jgi:hypothetical protein
MGQAILPKIVWTMYVHCTVSSSHYYVYLPIRCCFITVDPEMHTSQNEFGFDELPLKNKSKNIYNVTKNKKLLIT